MYSSSLGSRCALGRSRKSVGYPAEILPMVCEVYLDARDKGALQANQASAALTAYVLMRGLARVGIIALVDEATGYQEVRARQELQPILEAYVQAEFRPWIKRSPDEFLPRPIASRDGSIDRAHQSGLPLWES
jgi:hypothetical protein